MWPHVSKYHSQKQFVFVWPSNKKEFSRMHTCSHSEDNSCLGDFTPRMGLIFQWKWVLLPRGNSHKKQNCSQTWAGTSFPPRTCRCWKGTCRRWRRTTCSTWSSDGYRPYTTTHPHTPRLSGGMGQRRTRAVKEGYGSQGAKVHLKWTEPSNGLCCTLHSFSQSFSKHFLSTLLCVAVCRSVPGTMGWY